MPSTATITSFYNFTANTKARATQVNANFDILRGHLIAIDPNTSTAATTETYDLGSTEYRWRTGYFREIDFKSNTSTGQALQIVGDTAAGQGAFLFNKAGATHARFGGGNTFINLDTTTSQFDFKIAGSTQGSVSINKWVSFIPTSTGQWDFILNGSTLASIATGKFNRSLLVQPTTYGANINAATINTTTFQLIATLSMTSYGGPVCVGLNYFRNEGGVLYIYASTTGVTFGQAQFNIYRDGTAAGNNIYNINYAAAPRDTTTANPPLTTINNFSFIDTSCTSGAHTYYLYSRKSVSAYEYYDPGSGFIAIPFECRELL